MTTNTHARRGASLVLSCLLSGALTGAASAQTTLLTVDVPTAQAFGGAVDALGDVNGDGVPDFVTGTLNDDTFDTDAGAVRIVSGADGSILLTVYGDEKFDKLGSAVAGVGDLDGDGIPDFAASSQFSDALAADAGAIHVISGATGNVIRYLGNTTFKPFVGDVAALGDLNGDGLTEIVGSALYNGPTGKRGLIEVFDGATGASVWEFTGVTGINEVLGEHLAPLDDVDGDGYPDLLTSDRGDDLAGINHGRVWVLSGIDGSVIHEWAGTVDYERLGQCVAAAGDVDADGVPDMIVSCDKNDEGLSATTSLTHVYSGATGLRIHTVYDTLYQGGFGDVVFGIGDRDGDGRPEFAVSTLGGGTSLPGVVDIFAGSDARWLGRLTGSLPGDQFGQTLALLGDQDGDGGIDLVIGAGGGTNHYVRVQSVAGSFHDAGAGLAGSGGFVPALSGFGFPEEGAIVEIRATKALGGAATWTFLSFAQDAIPLAGGTLWLAAPWTLVRFTFPGGGAGGGSFTAPLTISPGLAGLSIFAQLLVVDPGAPFGLAFSNALEIAVE